MNNGLTEIIRKIFRESNEVTLKEIYGIIENHPDLNIESHLIKQRIRTTVDYLIKHNEIQRTSKGIYKKIVQD